MGYTKPTSCTAEDLSAVQYPNHGKTYTVIRHKFLIDAARSILKTHGFNIKNEEYKSTANGNIAQGIYQIESTQDSELGMMFAWSNSYDKSTRFQCGIGAFVKIQTEENEEYYKFLCQDQKKDIIDNDMLLKATERVKQIKSNKDIMSLLEDKVTDFELDPIEMYNEKYLQCELNDYVFGLKGYIDRYIIDHESKEITVIDFKTTSKGLEKFAETVDFYNYWMQAVIYITLVIKNSKKDISDYKINFNFVVVDNYDQTYVFDVSKETLNTWFNGLEEILKEANYHYIKRDYSLPYQFANKNVIL